MDNTMTAATETTAAPRLRWHRVYAGRYTATATCTLVGGPSAGRHVVEFTVEHMPMWDGPDKWAMTASIAPSEKSPSGTHLTRMTDVIGTTCASMKVAATIAARRGWRWYPSLGYCAD